MYGHESTTFGEGSRWNIFQSFTHQKAVHPSKGKEKPFFFSLQHFGRTSVPTLVRTYDGTWLRTY
jgi:hypothetical protein